MERIVSTSILALIFAVALCMTYGLSYLIPEPTPSFANVENEAGECTLSLPSNRNDLIRVEDEAWSMIRDSNDLADFRGFLNCFPNSVIATLAEQEYDKLVMNREVLMQDKIDQYQLMIPITYTLVTILLFLFMLIALPDRLLFNLINCTMGRPNEFQGN